MKREVALITRSCRTQEGISGCVTEANFITHGRGQGKGAQKPKENRTEEPKREHKETGTEKGTEEILSQNWHPSRELEQDLEDLNVSEKLLA